MPLIIWDSNEIELFVGDNSLKRIPSTKFSQNFGGTGKVETVTEYQSERYTFDAVYDFNKWRHLYSWFYGWASLGQVWSFAMAADQMVSTTLDGAAAADQKVIPLTSTTGIKVGQTMILTPAARTHREAIKVAKVTAGISITAADNLFYAYASGDGCRHDEYFPTVINTMPEFNYIQDGDYFFSTFEFIEDID